MKLNCAIFSDGHFEDSRASRGDEESWSHPGDFSRALEMTSGIMLHGDPIE
jgi:hypothetical protein